MSYLDFSKKTRKELIQLCKEKSLKGYSDKNKNSIIQILISKDKDEDVEDIKDDYTKEILIDQYKLHKQYISSRKKINNIRLPCFPEDISENIIKFINHKIGDKTSSWNCDKGDLKSLKYGKQECKCFASNGPISEWDELFFLDARYWYTKDKFILYRTRIKRNSDEWRTIKVNKNETFEQQSKQGRRPRIGWIELYNQIEKYCEKIFEGTFDEIF